MNSSIMLYSYTNGEHLYKPYWNFKIISCLWCKICNSCFPSFLSLLPPPSMCHLRPPFSCVPFWLSFPSFPLSCSPVPSLSLAWHSFHLVLPWQLDCLCHLLTPLEPVQYIKSCRHTYVRTYVCVSKRLVYRRGFESSKVKEFPELFFLHKDKITYCELEKALL